MRSGTTPEQRRAPMRARSTEGVGSPEEPERTNHTDYRKKRSTEERTDTTTVEGGDLGWPRDPNYDYPCHQHESEEENAVEHVMTRPPNAERTEHCHSNQVWLPSGKTAQLKKTEIEPGRTKGVTAGEEEGIVYDTNPPQHGTPSEVVCETQFYQNARNRGKFYNEIMTSIGLHSPTSLREGRIREKTIIYEQETGSPRATMPIRNSAANVLVLGKHALTPRHGRIWKYKGKSPLGGSKTVETHT